MFSLPSEFHVTMHLNFITAKALWEKPGTFHDEPPQQRTEKPTGPVSLPESLQGGQRFESQWINVSQRSMLSHELGAQIYKLGHCHSKLARYHQCSPTPGSRPREQLLLVSS